MARGVRRPGARPDLERVRSPAGLVAHRGATRKRYQDGNYPLRRHHCIRDPGAGRSVLPDDLERMLEGAEVCPGATGGRRAVESSQWTGRAATGAPGPDCEGPAVSYPEREFPAIPAVRCHCGVETRVAA